MRVGWAGKDCSCGWCGERMVNDAMHVPHIAGTNQSTCIMELCICKFAVYRKKIHLRSLSLRSNERKIFYFLDTANKQRHAVRWVLFITPTN